MAFDRKYQILSVSTGQYPATGDNNRAVSIPDTIASLNASALRLKCIARLLELYGDPDPRGLDEAVETLESIARFHE